MGRRERESSVQKIGKIGEKIGEIPNAILYLYIDRI